MAPHRLVVRARIVLAAADGVSNAVIARMLSLSEDTVRTWRGRFIDGGIAGLADRRRPGRPPRYGPQVHLRIVATVTGERPEAGSVSGSPPPRSGGYWLTWTSNPIGCAAG
jgi:transposase